MSDCDIAIVGGGLVGASLAVALADSGKRVTLIETAAFPDTAPSWDERCIALTDSSYRIFTALGIWPMLAANAAPILATHISERGRFGVARFTAAEVELDALGYNVPLRAIGHALWQRLRDSAVELICPATVIDVRTGDQSVVLKLQQAEGLPELEISARLVAAADGARSAVREHLKVASRRIDYQQHAMVSAVRIGRSHADVAYERFTPDGPIAVLPKPDKACSLVWTVPSSRVEALLALPEADYLTAAQDAFGGRLGPFLALGRRSAYPLSRVMSATLTAARTVFVGNAAQSLHPVAAQGFNLGLRDVATLAQTIAAEEDPGNAALLEDYAAQRQSDRSAVSDFTDTLVRTFSNRMPGLAQARHWGLLGLELLPPVRDRVLRQHLGRLGAIG